jgi:hypothetical protein
LLNKAELRGELNGVRVSVSNLLFADNSLILMQANIDNANCLKNILDQYCLASGQLVSKQKSSIFFGPNTLVKKREEICIVLDITRRQRRGGTPRPWLNLFGVYGQC